MNQKGYLKSIKRGAIYGILMLPLLALLTLIALSLSVKDTQRYMQVSGKSMKVLIDTTCSLEIEDVLHSKAFEKLNGGDVPNFGFNRSNVWLKFEIDPSILNSQNLTLQIKNTVLDVVELYEFKSTEFHTIAHTGDLIPFNTRPIPHRNYRFAISNAGGDPVTYYLKVNSGGEQLYIPLEAWEEQALKEFDQKDQLFLGAYFGIIVFVLIFNFFIYLLLKESSNLFYVQYNFFLMLLQFSLTGLATQFLWPNSAYLANVSNPFLASLAIYALLQFTRSFLLLKEHLPRINRLFDKVGWIILLNALLALCYHSTLLYISILFVNIITLVLNVVIIPITITVLRKGYQPAKFFLAAFIILIITVFGFVLTNLGLIENDFFATYGLLFGSASEVILLSFAIVDRFKRFKDEALENLTTLNKVVSEQNIVLENKVKERTLELFTQQQEVLSSIRYARRIQSGILPDKETFAASFKDHFIFYRPKDIVSGDFYRLSLDHKDKVWLALGDCTGHGVPGAMMTVLGSNLLRETIEKNSLFHPSEILEETDIALLNALSKGENGNLSDGMDLALLCIDKKQKKIEFSGANLSLYVYQKEQLREISCTRRPMGMPDISKQKPFINHVFSYEENDVLYLFSDGFADQFGGPLEKKIKQKRVLQLLEETYQENLIEQGITIKNFFDDWKKNLDQTDDVSMIGVRL